MRITGIALLFSLLQLLFQTTTAQNAKSSIKGLLVADSISSGNLKDVLISFFQLSFDKLTGPDKELHFSSNPYALLLKTDSTAAIDINYAKYRYLRKMNFGFGLKLDPSYKFNGFSSGIKYAFIDERDATTSKMLFRELGNDSLSIEINLLQTKLTEFIIAAFKNSPGRMDSLNKYNSLINQLFTDSTLAFNQLDDTFREMVLSVAKQNTLNRFKRLVQNDPEINIRTESQQSFFALKETLKQKLLWTVSISDTTYQNEFAFSNIVLKTQLLKGLAKKLKPGSNWEFNLQAALNFSDDTTSSKRDLQRAIFSFEPGVNWVIRARNTNFSFLELSFSGEYHHIFNQVYRNEEKNFFTFNGTFRLKIFNEIWIPIEFKYDPKRGNLFGFVNARFNFNSMKKFK